MGEALTEYVDVGSHRIAAVECGVGGSLPAWVSMCLSTFPADTSDRHRRVDGVLVFENLS